MSAIGLISQNGTPCPRDHEFYPPRGHPDLGVSRDAGWRSKEDVVGSHSQMAPEGPSGFCPPTSMKLSPYGSAAARHSGPGMTSVVESCHKCLRNNKLKLMLW